MVRESRRGRLAGANLLLIALLLLLIGGLLAWAWIGNEAEAPVPAETAIPDRMPAPAPAG